MTTWRGSVSRSVVLATEVAGDHRLPDAVRRVAGQVGMAALAVRLPGGTAPDLIAQQRRVARTILDEVARLHGGQVFVLGDGDLVLLAPEAALRLRRGTPGETVPDLLTRLFRAAPDGRRCVEVWRLPDERQALLSHAAGCMAEPSPSVTARQPCEPPARRGAGSDAPLPPALLHREMGVKLGGTGEPLLPLFREIGATDAALRAQREGWVPGPDGFMLRHLARREEPQLLAAVAAGIGRGGALDAATGPALHLNLSPAAVMSAGFDRLAALCIEGGIALGVEITLMEVVADPDGLADARRRLDAAGIAFVLDGMPVQALAMTEPHEIGAALVKLDWMPALASEQGGERDGVDAGLARLGLERVVLAGADAEAALQWGMRRGIRRFQGAHVDAMLAAGRIAICPEAGGCTLRQCRERASAVSHAGRAGCRNTALLDAGVPLG